MSLLSDFAGLERPLFVETGTNTGNTLANAAQVFQSCISIEQNLPLFFQACRRFMDSKNVHLYEGDSPVILRTLISSRIIMGNVPTTFWLDAHYFTNGDTLGLSGQCPLLAELEAILLCDWDTKPIIVIDDAFMFDDKINHPGFDKPFWFSNDSGYDNYDRKQWPRIEEIDRALSGFTRSMRSEFVLQYEGK